MAKIFIDPGHGGSDSGALGNGYREKDLTLKFALALRSKLQAGGITVGMSRTSDVDVDLDSRGRMMKGYDFGVSIHLNSGGGLGYELIVPAQEKRCDIEYAVSKEFDKLGENKRAMKVYSRQGYTGAKLARSLASATNFGEHYDCVDYYSINRNAWEVGTSADIWEMAFIDNASDLNNFLNKFDQYVAAAANALIRLFGGAKPAPVPTPKPVRKITQNHIFKIGDIATFPGIYTVNEVIKNGKKGFTAGAIASYELSYGAPFENNWIDAAPCDEVNTLGNKVGDQIFEKGERFRINGDFKVLDVYTETPQNPNGCIKVHIGQKDVVLDAGPAFYVYYE